jgi:hypothetical protein
MADEKKAPGPCKGEAAKKQDAGILEGEGDAFEEFSAEGAARARHTLLSDGRLHLAFYRPQRACWVPCEMLSIVLN